MKSARFLAVALIAVTSAFSALIPSSAMYAQQQDYLSPTEADKIRDAGNPNDRIKLFLDFAGDRLKKLQYELQLTTPQLHKEQILNGLLSAYSNCMDEAADRIQEAQKKGAPIRQAIKDMEKRGKAYLETLKNIEGANGPELTSYKDSLDDAIDGTQQALDDTAKASKEYGATPVRRKP